MSVRVALFALAFAMAGCAEAPPPAPSHPEPTIPTTPVATSSAPAPQAAETSTAPAVPPPAPAPPPADTCHTAEEFALAFQATHAGGKEADYVRASREKLLSPEDAPRALAGIAQEILSALAHRRYEKLAAFSAKEGICMRAAKGAECKMLSPQKLATCAAGGPKTEWAVHDGGDASPKYNCGEAFRKIFYARDFLHAKVNYDCFPAPGRGNNSAPVVLSGPRLGYVEAYTESPEGYRSLWLVFDGTPTSPELVEMISEYFGI